MRILLADHHPQALWALKTLLEEQPELKLVGEGADAQELLLVANDCRPDLILMDRELPGSLIQDLIARLHALRPRPVVIVMSSVSEYSRTSLSAGADAFVSKGEQPDWLLEILDKYVKQFNQKSKSIKLAQAPPSNTKGEPC